MELCPFWFLSQCPPRLLFLFAAGFLDWLEACWRRFVRTLILISSSCLWILRSFIVFVNLRKSFIRWLVYNKIDLGGIEIDRDGLLAIDIVSSLCWVFLSCFLYSSFFNHSMARFLASALLIIFSSLLDCLNISFEI